MLILPSLLETDTASLQKYDPILKFVSGAAGLFFPRSSSTAQLLFKPSSADSASELLYSAAYEGVPDAQFMLARWARSANAHSEALAWAELVKTYDQDDFVEDANGSNARKLLLAFQMSTPRQYGSEAKTRFEQLKKKCKRMNKCRGAFTAFLSEYSNLVTKRHSQSAAAFGLSWLGFQLISAHTVSAAKMTFAEVLNLDSQNAVASAFKSVATNLNSVSSSDADFDRVLDSLAPLMRQLGSIQEGIGWS